LRRFGGAEFAGEENERQRNFRGCKMQDWKMTDNVAGVENAGRTDRYPDDG